MLHGNAADKFHDDYRFAYTGSAKEAFAGASAIVLMVVNAAQAEAVLFSNGALEGAPAEAIVCLMATCPPKQVQTIAERVAMTGRRRKYATI